jgi:hypothetical protein
MKIEKLDVQWNGGDWSLCMGEWSVHINDAPIALPKEFLNDHMDTAGEYDTWHFEDWSDVWETYYCGLDRNEWIKENKVWIEPWLDSLNLEYDNKDLENLYNQISDQDFRPNSCGGCI